jgi:hypothetical protein
VQENERLTLSLLDVMQFDARPTMNVNSCRLCRLRQLRRLRWLNAARLNALRHSLSAEQ